MTIEEMKEEIRKARPCTIGWKWIKKYTGNADNFLIDLFDYHEGWFDWVMRHTKLKCPDKIWFTLRAGRFEQILDQWNCITPEMREEAVRRFGYDNWKNISPVLGALVVKKELHSIIGMDSCLNCMKAEIPLETRDCLNKWGIKTSYCRRKGRSKLQKITVCKNWDGEGYC